MLSVSDPRSANWVTRYEYNANNQMVKQTQPVALGNEGFSGSPETRIDYDALGRQVALRDANGNTNRQVYDAAGQLVKELHADGGIVQNFYDAFGNKVKTVDAEDNIARFAYDAAGRLLSVTRSGKNDELLAVYAPIAGSGGEVQRLADRAIVESYTYDAAGRLATQTNGNGETTKYSYDRRGNLVIAELPMGQKTQYGYDALDRKVLETDANAKTVTWQYDYFGQLLGHRDLAGNVYGYSYDNARQLTRQTHTGGQELVYAYDAAGQLLQTTDVALNKVTELRYDLAGNHVLERTTQNGAVYQDNHLAYDELNRLRWMSDGTLFMRMDYDAVGNRYRIITRHSNPAAPAAEAMRCMA